MTGEKTLLALAAYPERAAATRFRMVHMFPYLRAQGWNIRFEPFVSDEFFDGFYTSGSTFRKASYLAARSLDRLRTTITGGHLDAVFVQREASMIGPAFAEAILTSVRRTPLVFDFDDAIWHFDLPRSRYPLAARLLKSPGKCWSTMRRAALVLAGSSYLAGRASEVNANVECVPTVVPATTWTPISDRLDGGMLHSPPRIGWVGSHSTAHQLELVAPALRRLRAEGLELDIRIVGAPDDFVLEGLELDVAPWRVEDEIREFQEIDIGLAPMHSEPVYEGKCGFKQLQYMAVGAPCVSSWVGGARDFVVDGENALVARDEGDWYRHIRALLEQKPLRRRLARGGRTLIETQYCIEHQGPRVAKRFAKAVGHA